MDNWHPCFPRWCVPCAFNLHRRSPHQSVGASKVHPDLTRPLVLVVCVECVCPATGCCSAAPWTPVIAPPRLLVHLPPPPCDALMSQSHSIVHPCALQRKYCAACDAQNRLTRTRRHATPSRAHLPEDAKSPRAPMRTPPARARTAATVGWRSNSTVAATRCPLSPGPHSCERAGSPALPAAAGAATYGLVVGKCELRVMWWKGLARQSRGSV